MKNINDRLNGLLSDAEDHGAELVEINPANEDFSQQESHKIPTNTCFKSN